MTLENKEVIGKRVGDISPTENFIIVAIYENGKITIPSTDLILKQGMKVSVLVKSKYARTLLKRFTKS